jgi:hypothetical protein
MQPAHNLPVFTIADPALHHQPAQWIPRTLGQRPRDLHVLQHVVGHTVVDPVRAIAVAEYGIEADRVQVDHLVGVTGVAQAFAEALQNRVTERARVVMRVDRQNSHARFPITIDQRLRTRVVAREVGPGAAKAAGTAHAGHGAWSKGTSDHCASAAMHGSLPQAHRVKSTSQPFHA